MPGFRGGVFVSCMVYLFCLHLPLPYLPRRFFRASLLPYRVFPSQPSLFPSPPPLPLHLWHMCCTRSVCAFLGVLSFTLIFVCCTFLCFFIIFPNHCFTRFCASPLPHCARAPSFSTHSFSMPPVVSLRSYTSFLSPRASVFPVPPPPPPGFFTTGAVWSITFSHCPGLILQSFGCSFLFCYTTVFILFLLTVFVCSHTCIYPLSLSEHVSFSPLTVWHVCINPAVPGRRASCSWPLVWSAVLSYAFGPAFAPLKMACWICLTVIGLCVSFRASLHLRAFPGSRSWPHLLYPSTLDYLDLASYAFGAVQWLTHFICLSGTTWLPFQCSAFCSPPLLVRAHLQSAHCALLLCYCSSPSMSFCHISSFFTISCPTYIAMYDQYPMPDGPSAQNSPLPLFCHYKSSICAAGKQLTCVDIHAAEPQGQNHIPPNSVIWLVGTVYVQTSVLLSIIDANHLHVFPGDPSSPNYALSFLKLYTWRDQCSKCYI